MPKNSLAKARALRIPLDFGRGDHLARYRNTLAIAAVMACIGWLLVVHVSRRSLADHYGPGPLSNAHAHLNCDSCHDQNAPLFDSTFLSGWKSTNADKQGPWHRPADTMCQSCHPVIGSASRASDAIFKNENLIPVAGHANNQVIETVDSCASCHSEHRGLDHLPSQVADATCIACHRQLEDFRVTQDSEIDLNIVRFDEGHPDFRSLAQDKGVLNFSHQVHLAPGVFDKDNQESLMMKPSHYSDPSGQLEGLVNSEGLIQLDCHFCHHPSDEPVLGSSLPSSSSGKFMSMPTYEQNCQVCHTLQIEAQAADVPRNGLPPQQVFKEQLRVEHGASSEEILNDLRVYFSLESVALSESSQPLKQKDVNRPGSLPTRFWDFEIGKPERMENITSKVEEVAIRLRNECLRCHLKSKEVGPQQILAVRSMADGLPAANRSCEMFETTLLKHARFDHAAHRDFNCARCHSNSAGKSKLKNVADDIPMITNQASCVECHQDPSGVSVPRNRPGPTSCTSCHTYHGGGNRQ